jgi:Thioredoxin
MRFYPKIKILADSAENKTDNAFALVLWLNRVYSNWYRDAQSLRAWLFEFLPSLVTNLDGKSFKSDVLSSTEPWIVDFFAPWCGHCQVFAPEFERVAQVSSYPQWGYIFLHYSYGCTYGKPKWNKHFHYVYFWLNLTFFSFLLNCSFACRWHEAVTIAFSFFILGRLISNWFLSMFLSWALCLVLVWNVHWQILAFCGFLGPSMHIHDSGGLTLIHCVIMPKFSGELNMECTTIMVQTYQFAVLYSTAS